MLFTSFDFVIFLVVVFTCYWSLNSSRQRKAVLLIASYVFYGWHVPWFCLLIFTSTIVDYFVGLWIISGRNRKACLAISLVTNLGLLAIFKYNNFFIHNFSSVISHMGGPVSLPLLNIVLPVGISFYTFQTLSYSIDVYRGAMQPRRNFIDFALFVSFFPQLVAGPIERAHSFIPQIEEDKKWSWVQFDSAWPLIVRGFFKKLVIADNVSVFVDKIFLLENPGLLFLVVGTFVFSVQIYTDFSGYTDIARGVARLFGFNLMKNFNNPFLALTPSDFWRRWHISLSSWIRDYVYISFGGSRHGNALMHGFVIISTMLLSGLWHGAAWNFVLWGGYHGVLLVVYHLLGMGGSWKPKSAIGVALAWGLMFLFVQLGWLLFRAPDISWLMSAVSLIFLSSSPEGVAIALYIVGATFLYCVPLSVLALVDRLDRQTLLLKPIYGAVMMCLIVLFHSRSSGDFIYFQF